MPQTACLAESSDDVTGQNRRAKIRCPSRGVRGETESISAMDYLLVLGLLIVVPLAIFVLMHRPRRAGGPAAHDHGVTPSEPAADQPTPLADSINRVRPGSEKRIPPG